MVYKNKKKSFFLFSSFNVSYEVESTTNQKQMFIYNILALV